MCAAANRPPALSLWPNPLLGGGAAVGAWLEEAGAVGVRDAATGVLRVEGPLDVAGSHAFASGAVVPIARAAVLVAQRVGAEPGMRVLDLCAAPGGKTAVLAATGAAVTAVDAHPGRAKALAATLRRLGVDAEVVTADGRSYRGGPFDRILVDAPCSGLGVLAGRPDARWRRSRRTRMSSRRCRPSWWRTPAGLLAPGGELHFAVCTLNPGERGDRDRGRPGAHDELRTWPDEGDDGFYAARLRTVGPDPTCDRAFGARPQCSLARIGALAADRERIEDGDDGGVDRAGRADGLAGRRALGDEHELAVAGADRVDGDERIARIATRGVGRPHDHQRDGAQGFGLDGCDGLADHAADDHRRIVRTRQRAGSS